MPYPFSLAVFVPGATHVSFPDQLPDFSKIGQCMAALLMIQQIFAAFFLRPVVLRGEQAELYQIRGGYKPVLNAPRVFFYISDMLLRFQARATRSKATSRPIWKLEANFGLFDPLPLSCKIYGNSEWAQFLSHFSISEQTFDSHSTLTARHSAIPRNKG